MATRNELTASLQTAQQELLLRMTERKAEERKAQDLKSKLYDLLLDSLRFNLLTPYEWPHGTEEGPAIKDLALIAHEVVMGVLHLQQFSSPTALADFDEFALEGLTDIAQALRNQMEALAGVYNPSAHPGVKRNLAALVEYDASLPLGVSKSPHTLGGRLLLWMDGIAAELLRRTAGEAPFFGQEALRWENHLRQVVSKALLLDEGGQHPHYDLLRLRYEEVFAGIRTLQGDILSLEGTVSSLQAQLEALGLAEVPVERPLLLFPVRVEAKFVADPTQDASHQLYVRIFPDELAIQTHEASLTPREAEDGAQFWELSFRNATENWLDLLEEWKVLVGKYASPRAGYVARQTRPTNYAALLSTVEGGSGYVEGSALFPSVPLKEGNHSWTQPARSYVMPEQFAVHLYASYPSPAPTVSAYGNTVPHPLQVGINPSSEGLSLSAEGQDNIIQDPEIQWLTDFEAAVSKGMGIRIALSAAQYAEGFDRLVVVGLKFDQSPAASQAILEDLFDSHHYTGGLRFLPHGTATNNTTAKGSGYSERDALDAEATLSVELGQGLSATTGGGRLDSQRLAGALGIGLGHFDFVADNRRQDVQEAVAMNVCLWNATLGYYFEELLRPVFNQAEIDLLRSFFTQHVSGRGPLPAFSIGNQPYGVLPTSAFSQWESAVGTGDAFHPALDDILATLTADWQALAPAAPPTAGGGLQELLQVLGLEAGSSEFYQRYGFGPKMTETILDEGNQASSLQTQAASLGFGQEVPKILRSALQSDFRELAETSSDAAFTDRYTLGHLVDRNPFSETTPIQNFPGTDKNFLHWLEESSFEQVRQESFAHLYADGVVPATFEKPRSLLYLLMRHSLLLGYWDAAMRITGNEAREELELRGVLADDPSRWAVLDSLLPVSAGGGDGRTLRQFLEGGKAALRNGTVEGARFLGQVYDGLAQLADLPTARLERVFVEHLDLCSHRVDAWRVGQVTEKLSRLRLSTASPSGIQLGAFGWLEDLRQRGAQTNDVQAIQLDRDNQGFLQAPSLNQATAAAILRQGFTAQKARGGGDGFTVDLSSGRVRQALALIEGIREGQMLGALLGYQFERYLHESHSLGAEVSQYVYDFREAFPLAGTGDLSARQVVDGLKMLEGFRATSSFDDFLVAAGVSIRVRTVTDGSGSEVADIDRWTVREAVEELHLTLDALGDLLVAEGVYQTVMGKFETASASLDNLSQGQAPPMPEIVQSTPSEMAFTQRVLLSMTPGAPVPAAWAAGVLTPMAQAEPTLNAWLGEILHCLALVEVRVHSGDRPPFELALTDLGLQPIDFLYLLNTSSPLAGSPLLDRIRHHVGTLPLDPVLPAEDTVEVDFSYSAAGPSLRQALPLVVRVKELIAGSRAAQAGDLTQGDVAPLHPTGIDLAEVHARLVDSPSALPGFLALHTALTDALADGGPDTEPGRSGLRSILLDLAAFHLHEGLAPAASQTDGLLGIAQGMARLLDKRRTALEALLNGGQELSSFEEYQEMARLLFGRDFILVPRFGLTADSQSSLAGAVANSPQLLRHHLTQVDERENNPLVMDEWLQGLARVKNRMGQLEKVTILSDVLNDGRADSELHLVPAQLPAQFDYLPNGVGVYADYWLGAAFPEGYRPESDKLSLVLLQTGEPMTDLPTVLAGLVVEEWVETIPLGELPGAVAFHFDQPQSHPPQTLLLAVSPANVGFWDRGQLLGCVNETLDLAKVRSVEPDQLAGTHYAQLLPALVAPVSSGEGTITLEFGKAIGDPLFSS